MTDIKPISNENDLRREAESNSVHSVIEQPIIHEPISQIPSSNSIGTVGSVVSNQTNEDGLKPSSIRIESQAINSKINSIDDKGKPFAYRIPVFNYVLAWFYIVATIIILIMLISSSISYYEAYNSYSSYSGSESYPSYGKLFMPSYIILAYCIAMVLFMLIARKLMRIYGIIFSIGLIGYVAYVIIMELGPLLGENNNIFIIMMSSMSLYLTIYVSYLPYVLLPLISIIYLFTPKAIRAFK